jgi:hypothetical protein
MEGKTYLEILAEEDTTARIEYSENAKDLLVEQTSYEDTVIPPEDKHPDEIENQEEFRKFGGSHQQASTSTFKTPYTDKTKLSVGYEKDVRTQVISIDSRFRTNPADGTTNFFFRLLTPIKNAISIRLSSIEVPNTFYAFSALKSNLSFNILKNNVIYCLSLIETPERYRLFYLQDVYLQHPELFELYPAIKYSPGWLGCGFSYYNLIYNAKRQNLSYLTVCEDDCCLNFDFIYKYNIIKEFLQEIPEWDIFVGVIASLPEDTILNKVYKYKGMTFIEINKMHSMVFNIYNNTSYDKILEWNINDTDVYNNTIDVYIKNCNFKIIVPFPFEFSCLDAMSTLWGKNLFERYNEKFEESNVLIKKLIDEYVIDNDIIYI